MRSNVAFLTSVLLAIIVCLSPGSAQAQCVKCVPAPPGWMCVSAGQGGEGCITDALQCTLVNPCTCTGEFCPEGLRSLETNKIKIDIPDSIIREVGKIDSNLAVVLVTLRRLPPAGYLEGIVNLASIDLNIDDVESHLGTGSALMQYKDDLKQRVERSFAEGLPPISYTFNLTKVPEKYSMRIEPSVPKSGIAGNGIEIDFSATESGKDSGTNTLTVIAWRQL